MLWVSEYAFYYVRLGEMQLGTITWSKNVYYISLFELIILNRQKKKKTHQIIRERILIPTSNFYLSTLITSLDN